MPGPSPADTSSWHELRERLSPRVRLVQFISDLSYGDASTSDCMEIHWLLQRWGFQASVYADRIDSHHRQVGRHYLSYRPQDRDLIIFHYSAWSGAAQFLL